MNEYFSIIRETLLGLVFLCLLSAFQKIFLGTAHTFQTYLIPGMFGGLMGGILGYLRIQAESVRNKLSTQIMTCTRERDDALKKIHSLEEKLCSVKTLPEILPSCASCKKIHDGQGGWREMADYIEQKTNSRFSHGLCPECAQALYPNMLKSNNIDQSKPSSNWDISNQIHPKDHEKDDAEVVTSLHTGIKVQAF